MAMYYFYGIIAGALMLAGFVKMCETVEKKVVLPMIYRRERRKWNKAVYRYIRQRQKRMHLEQTFDVSRCFRAENENVKSNEIALLR